MSAPDKKKLFYLSWITLVGMSAIGILLVRYNCGQSGPHIDNIISYKQKREVLHVLLGGQPYYLQLLSGLFFGTFSSLLAVALINGRKFGTVRHFFEKLIQRMNPTFPNIVFFSFCAGIGEEILFRAGIQPMIGIWWASIIFVFLHGYIHPSNLSLTVYGIFLVVVCAGFGYLFKFFGLTSAIVAHFVYDVSMFTLLKYPFKTRAADNP